LQLLSRSTEVEAAAYAVLLECAAKFSPRIEAASEGTGCALVLDIAGMELLFGPPEKLAGRLRDEMATADFRVSNATSANFHTAQIVEEAARATGPLLRGIASSSEKNSPLATMTTEEHLVADYSGAGLTTGPHPMAYYRGALRSEGILAATDLLRCKCNASVRIAGCVIARQRPGTAKGFVFLSLEDETGIANIILTPDVFEQDRLLVTRRRFLLIHGGLQNNDGVVHVKAQRILPLEITESTNASHDFH
jgi:DNA polymerase III alpha subunit